MNAIDVLFDKSYFSSSEVTLLIDNKPIPKYFEGKFIGVDLICWEGVEESELNSKHKNSAGEKYKIIGTCSCGELGCDYLCCRVSNTENSVVFDKFDKDPNLKFEFSNDSYQDVMNKIAEEKERVFCKKPK